MDDFHLTRERLYTLNFGQVCRMIFGTKVPKQGIAGGRFMFAMKTDMLCDVDCVCVDKMYRRVSVSVRIVVAGVRIRWERV